MRSRGVKRAGSARRVMVQRPRGWAVTLTSVSPFERIRMRPEQRAAASPAITRYRPAGSRLRIRTSRFAGRRRTTASPAHNDGMVRVPVWTAQRAGRSVQGIARLLRPIVEARTYARILYLLLALPLGVAEFVFLVTAISFGFGTAITLIGIP